MTFINRSLLSLLAITLSFLVGLGCSGRGAAAPKQNDRQQPPAPPNGQHIATTAPSKGKILFIPGSSSADMRTAWESGLHSGLGSSFSLITIPFRPSGPDAEMAPSMENSGLKAALSEAGSVTAVVTAPRLVDLESAGTLPPVYALEWSAVDAETLQKLFRAKILAGGVFMRTIKDAPDKIEDSAFDPYFKIEIAPAK
jgi:hypothetical protein